MTSALWSEYIIDGVRMDSVPGAMLEEACGRKASVPQGLDPVVDDTLDEIPSSLEYAPKDIPLHASMLAKAGNGKRREAPMGQAGAYTKCRIAAAILDAIWRTGHFRLSDLSVSIAWKWNTKAEGAMAAFHESVSVACECLRDLWLDLSGYSFEEAEVSCIEVAVSCDETQTSNEEDGSQGRTHLGKGRKCHSTMGSKASDWVVYIPFDEGERSLGGSLLAQLTGNGGGKAPALEDAEYFVDCYEVVRELVEDGIVTAGVAVGDGGLMTALERFVPQGHGLRAQLGDLAKASEEKDMTRLLFSEIPGVLLEIDDDDFDYLDAELLLQEVAYYPLGHPSKRFSGVRVSESWPSDISGIIGALLSGQASEGED